MCGIFGFFVTRAELPRVEQDLGPALASLHHRGPDDRGTATSVGASHAVAMGQARLAILDLSAAGHQPMASEDGRYLLVLNGEIYNHRELRPELEAAGVVFMGTSDTETVLHLLMRHGLAAIDRLIGMFALAFWDRDRDELLLVRDRLGKKPLYLARDAHGLAFSSEVRALLATGHAPRRLDRGAVTRWLGRGSTRDPETLFPGVTQVPPGHALRVTPHGMTEHRYWQLPEGPPPIDWRERLVELLDSAVHLRLLSDRPLGVFLSGGVDSAAIAAIAARHQPKSLDTFTLTFDEARFDEGDRAAALARHLGVRHHAAHLRAHEALASIDEALASQDLPSHDGLNTWFVTRAARAHGLVVALAGTGGDELFAGYPHFRSFPRWLALGERAKLLPQALRSRLADGLSPHVPTRLRKALGLLATDGEPERVYDLLREMFSPSQARSLIAGHPHAAHAAHAARPAARHQAHDAGSVGLAMTRLELAGYLVDTQLRDIDVMSMAHGFEVRAPLLDHRLVELMATVPAEVKNPPGPINKKLLVRSAGLPLEMFDAPKRGFVLPWHEWLAGPLAGWVDAHLDPSKIETTGILDASAARTLVRTFRHGRLGPLGAVGYSRVLALVALQAFCTRHRIDGFA